MLAKIYLLRQIKQVVYEINWTCLIFIEAPEDHNLVRVTVHKDVSAATWVRMQPPVS